MAISNKEVQKIAIFGAVAGLVTPLLMSYIVMPILNFLAGIVPGISLKLAEHNPQISVAVRDSLVGVNTGLAEKVSAWIADIFGLTATIPMQAYVFAALGGALFFVVGAYGADALNMLKGNSEKKTRAVIWIGSIIAGFVLGGMVVPAIGIDLVNTLIAFAVNAAILAFVYVGIDKQFKLGLVPF